MKIHYLFRILLIIIGSGSFYLVKAQCELTTEGTEFWVGFLKNYAYDIPKTLELHITSKTATTCKIYTQAGNTLFATITIAANSSQQVTINPYTNYSFADQQILNQGIYIRSNAPVSVFAIHTNPSSSDVTIVYPINTLGKEYYTLSHEPSGILGAQIGITNNAQFLLIATENNTVVEIIPKAETNQGNLPNIPFTISFFYCYCRDYLFLCSFCFSCRNT